MNYLYKTKEENSAFTPLSIPENIRLKVQQRGFYVYNWIGATDVKNSIERDFLKTLNIV